MANDPRDIMTNLVHPEARGDFLAERKRLREARMKWIDEHEMPQAMDVRDAAGNQVTTPFQVGKQTYAADYDTAAAGHKDAKKGFIPEVSEEDQKAVLAQLDDVITQYNQFSGITTRDRSGEEVSFSHKSDHPPIREGETHEEWFIRVTDAYSKTPEEAGSGSTGADTDSVRRSAEPDSSDQRATPGAGAEVGQPHRADLGGLAVRDDAGGPEPTGAVPSRPADAAHSDGPSETAADPASAGTGSSRWNVRALWRKR